MLNFVNVISTLEHIRYLILTRDCVIVPAFGAFVSRRISAVLSADGTCLAPPVRELSFNSALSHDDGILIGSITRREGISYECARNIVEQEVELIQRRLRNEGQLELPRIGTLTLTPHQTVDFSPADNCIAALPCLGLPVLRLADEPVVTELTEDTSSQEVENDVAPVGRHRFLQPLKYAAAAAVLAGVCLTFLTPINPRNITFASLQPNITSTVQQPDEAFERPLTLPDNRTILISRPDPEEATAPVMSESKKQQLFQIAEYNAYLKARQEAASVSASKRVSPAVTQSGYYVIVASCASMSEAKRYIKRHNGHGNLGIIPSDGFYRIFAAHTSDIASAQAFRSSPSFATANPNAWIYSAQ